MATLPRPCLSTFGLRTYYLVPWCKFICLCWPQRDLKSRALIPGGALRWFRKGIEDCLPASPNHGWKPVQAYCFPCKWQVQSGSLIQLSTVVIKKTRTFESCSKPNLSLWPMAALSWKKLHNNLGISNLVSFSSSITSCSIYNSQRDTCFPNSCHHKVKLAPKRQTVLFSALYKHVHAHREARPHAKYHKTVPTDSLAILLMMPKAM